VRLSIKLALLSVVLAVDLSFFLFFRTYFPHEYELVFQKMPWPDDLEKMFATIIGLVTAILTSLLITRITVKRLLQSITRG